MAEGNWPAGIVGMAFRLSDVVAEFAGRAKRFFYEVMLHDRHCPKCGGRPRMVREGLCHCEACGEEFDPTLKFQRCPSCGGEPVLRVRRYQCRSCRGDVPSLFLFDGLVFDGEYFRQKMAEHRQRRLDLRERVREMLAAGRSGPLEPGAANLEDIPGLIAAFDGLTAELDSIPAVLPGSQFDLRLYEGHLQAHIGGIRLGFDQIPPLVENRRLDRVRRFTAMIFLAHSGWLDVQQEGPNLWVMKRETDRKGQGIPGDLEEPDEFQGPIRGTESW